MIKTDIKLLLFLFVAIVFSGCTFKQTIIEISHYAIEYKTDKSSYQSSLKSIYVEAPTVNKSFNTNAILYTQKPYLFEQYAKNRWINMPSNMIHNYLVQSLENSNIFKAVLQKSSSIEFDYTLKSNITNLYHSFEGKDSFAILKVKFDLVSKKELVKTYSYDKKILCKTNSPYSFIIAVNKAFEEMSKNLSLQLSKEIK